MLNWLNQNAGAVQAVAAVVIVLLTGALVGVTVWYAKLTRRMSKTMEHQLAASCQPDVDLTLLNTFQGTGRSLQGEVSENISGTIVVTNNSVVPIKITAIAMKIIFDDKKLRDVRITQDARQLVMPPSNRAEFRHLLRVADNPPGAAVSSCKRVCDSRSGRNESVTFEFGSLKLGSCDVEHGRLIAESDTAGGPLCRKSAPVISLVCPCSN